ncbi:hypothetical protein BGW80DRAFT_1309129 [Lactifluus volemus]|nr:hypothetical protein BGW80DRAFT_1309129 [Lactifluus volemus]
MFVKHFHVLLTLAVTITGVFSQPVTETQAEQCAANCINTGSGVCGRYGVPIRQCTCSNNSFQAVVLKCMNQFCPPRSTEAFLEEARGLCVPSTSSVVPAGPTPRDNLS